MIVFYIVYNLKCNFRYIIDNSNRIVKIKFLNSLNEKINWGCIEIVKRHFHFNYISVFNDRVCCTNRREFSVLKGIYILGIFEEKKWRRRTCCRNKRSFSNKRRELRRLETLVNLVCYRSGKYGGNILRGVKKTVGGCPRILRFVKIFCLLTCVDGRHGRNRRDDDECAEHNKYGSRDRFER